MKVLCARIQGETLNPSHCVRSQDYVMEEPSPYVHKAFQGQRTEEPQTLPLKAGVTSIIQVASTNEGGAWPLMPHLRVQKSLVLPRHPGVNCCPQLSLLVTRLLLCCVCPVPCNTFLPGVGTSPNSDDIIGGPVTCPCRCTVSTDWRHYW